MELKEIIEKANIIRKISTRITQYSGIIGVVVILGWSIKVGIYINIITATIIKEGSRLISRIIQMSMDFKTIVKINYFAKYSIPAKYRTGVALLLSCKMLCQTRCRNQLVNEGRVLEIM